MVEQEYIHNAYQISRYSKPHLRDFTDGISNQERTKFKLCVEVQKDENFDKLIKCFQRFDFSFATQRHKEKV